jgi:ElaB/YqjD/DUF883 family membrane-anchored ribosome-binding protein
MATTDMEKSGGTAKEGGDRQERRAGTGGVRQSASEAYESARQRTAALYGSARDRASSAIVNTRDSAARVGRRTADEIEANPVAAVAGGLAIGALLAVLLPRTRRENEMLGAVGGRITDAAREAAAAARDAGQDKLDELGLTREGARQKLSELASSASEAIRSSASAAAERARKSR